MSLPDMTRNKVGRNNVMLGQKDELIAGAVG